MPIQTPGALSICANVAPCVVTALRLWVRVWFVVPACEDATRTHSNPVQPAESDEPFFFLCLKISV